MKIKDIFGIWPKNAAPDVVQEGGNFYILGNKDKVRLERIIHKRVALRKKEIEDNIDRLICGSRNPKEFEGG